MTQGRTFRSIFMPAEFVITRIFSGRLRRVGILSGSRYKLCSLIIIFLFAQSQHTTTAAPWSAFEVVLNKFMKNTSILVVFHEFGYTSQFFRGYPYQQVLSNPDRYFKTCPFPRVLVVSGLNHKFFLTDVPSRTCSPVSFGNRLRAR